MELHLISNIDELRKERNVREIYLFGSVARGDYDEYSDVDILIVIDDCTEDEYIKIKDRYAILLNVPVSWLSVYRVSKIIQMHAVGSYFLWHIKKEGKELYSKEGELASLLLTLPQYAKVRSDLEEYESILADMECELNSEYISVEYELAVLASLVRNTCIAISFVNGRLDFGRNSVVLHCFTEYDFDICQEEYNRLYQYRLYQTGKMNSVPEGEKDFLRKWIEVERKLLFILKKGVDDYEGKVVSRMG